MKFPELDIAHGQTREQVLAAVDAWITTAYNDRRRWHATVLAQHLDDLDDPDDIDTVLSDFNSYHDTNLEAWRDCARIAMEQALAARPELGLA